MRKTTLRRKGKSKLSLLQRKLWELCKQIIRKTHGNVCYTCYATGLEGGNWHTGHFITKSICSTELKYSLDNLRPQCYRCNIHLSGNWVAYEKHLLKDKGAKYTEELKAKNEATKGQQFDRLWYYDKIKEYEEILKR